ncbi:hypothetical protein [Lysobacter sp. A3-1-A15]|uniref:hypothetical protein n=1 Tax=Novilysobacter viscosus TaxID=3098602 RepID=UPI003983B17A
MRRLVLALVSLTGAAMAHAQGVESCASLAAPRALPVQPTVVAPLAPGLATPSHQLGAPTGVLANAFDESRSVDQVLFRLQLEQCRSVASLMPPVSPAAPLPAAVPGVAPGTVQPVAPTSTDPAAYQPKTEFDNTPWRFDMNQNGKRMTADEFSAWMKSKGVRVARGAPKAAPTMVDPAAPVVEGEVQAVPAAMPSPPPAAEVPPPEAAQPEVDGDQ